MKIFWALVAVACGALGGITVWTVGRQALLHRPTVSSLFVLAFALAMLYVAWRSALRARRHPVTMPVPPSPDPVEVGLAPHRVIASLIFAVIVMFVTFAVAFSLAESGKWGGEHGVLYWSVGLLGHGTLAVAELLHLRSLFLIAEAIQFSLLVAVFYSLATWWERRRSRALAEGTSAGVASSILPTPQAAALSALVLGMPVLLAAVVTVATRAPTKTIKAYQDSGGKWHSDAEKVAPPVLTAGIPVFNAVSFQGEVVMEALVNSEGKVEDLRLDDSRPKKLRGIDVEEAKDAAVQQWTYKPATLEGQPVPVFLRIVVTFRPASKAERRKP
jgi:hypothetical protein